MFRRNFRNMHLKKWIILLCLFLGLTVQTNVYAASVEEAKIPSLVSSLKTDAPLTFCDEKVPYHPNVERRN